MSQAADPPQGETARPPVPQGETARPPVPQGETARPPVPQGETARPPVLPGERLGPPQPVAEGALVAPPEVVAAVAAAVELCWPRPARSADLRQPATGPEYVWRFSGRWWSKPVALRRDRPWTLHGREHGQVDSNGS